MPKISPLRTVNEMSAILPGEVRPTTERPSSSVGVLIFAYSSDISRPTIMRMRLARSTSASGPEPT